MNRDELNSHLEPRACPACLRRSWLLAALAPYIERASGVPSTGWRLLGLPSERLAETVARQAASRILTEVKAIPERQLYASLKEAECWACCQHDDAFPAGLQAAPSTPWALIGRGNPAALAKLTRPDSTVAIVGARRASSYGREVARELGRGLASEGVTVLSGMAFGVDACGHRGALEAGCTVAVLGCGPDVAYPASHRSLWRRIQENGLVISELPPGTGAWRWSFPARNRIVAGLGAMTVVVEAAERSGSLITARQASKLGRVVGAVPGPVSSPSSAGTNEMLAQGATLVRNAADILAALPHNPAWWPSEGGDCVGG